MILRDERSGTEYQVGEGGVRLGRDPELDIVFSESEDIVSALHCRVVFRDDAWWIEDLGSTNGTWLNGQRLAEPARLSTGQRFSLGQRGPSLKVTVPGQVARTQAEPAIDPARPMLRLRRVKGGEDLIAAGHEIVIGRVSGCQISLRTIADTVVSKRHAVIAFDEAGVATVLDLGSRNGTFLNGQPVRSRTPIVPGDSLMLGWHGPIFEVRVLGARAMAEGEGSPYQPKREPPKSLSGMVSVAEEKARDATGVRPGIFVSTMARQMATESSALFRITTLVLFAGVITAVALVYRGAAQRTADAEARLVGAQRAFSQQLHEATEAQKQSGAQIAALRRQLDAARRTAVSRAVVDSLEHRLREAEALQAQPQSTAPDAGSVHDWTGIVRDNGRSIGLVIARFASDSIMGSGFVVTPSGYFVTTRHVVRDDARGDARQVYVVMAETNVALPADVVSVSSLQSQDVAVLRIHGFHGPAVHAIDWTGRAAQQGAPAAVLGFPFGTQLAADQSGVVRSTLFAGYIAGQTGEWLRFSGPTYAGVSGSPVFNSRGEVIALHFGAPREGIGMGISVPMSKVRRWLPPEVRTELGL